MSVDEKLGNENIYVIFLYFSNTGDVIPFLDIATSTMKKAEITRFLVKPEYAYGDMGVPPRIPGGANSKF